MRKKLVAWLSGAGALVVSGTLLTIALTNSRQTLGMTCDELREAIRVVSSEREKGIWCVSIPQGYDVPTAFQAVTNDYRVIGIPEGDAKLGQLLLKEEECQGSYGYDYRRSDVADGRSVYEFFGDLYFANSWKKFVEKDAADDPPGNLWWFGSCYEDIKTKCLAKSNGAHCRTWFGSLFDCWTLSDGTRCRNGIHYGGAARGGVKYVKGIPVQQTCVPDNNATPYLCDDKSMGKDYAEEVLAEDFDTRLTEYVNLESARARISRPQSLKE